MVFNNVIKELGLCNNFGLIYFAEESNNTFQSMYCIAKINGVIYLF